MLIEIDGKEINSSDFNDDELISLGLSREEIIELRIKEIDKFRKPISV